MAKKSDTTASIMVVLDRSGSMSACRDATIDGFNQFLAEQQQLPGAKFSMIQFDSDGIDTLYSQAKVGSAKPLDHESYEPRSMTPLFDAIGRGIRTLEQAKPAGKVIFTIITDGQENASHEFTRQSIYDLVTAKRADGWEFVFMGAGIDAYAAGAQVGVLTRNIYAYAATPDSTQSAWANLSGSSTSYRSGQAVSMAMPDVDTADPTYVPGGGKSTVRPGGAARSQTLPKQTLGPTNKVRS